MRLVDADAFKAEGRELYREAGWDLREVHYSQMDVECNIDMMPTIEAEPIKHGRWEFIGATTRGAAIINRYACSECGYEADTTNYCPNCGVRMDGGENDRSDRR